MAFMIGRFEIIKVPIFPKVTQNQEKKNKSVKIPARFSVDNTQFILKFA